MSFKNIYVMLGTGAALAIKKTVPGSVWKCQKSVLREQSLVGGELPEGQDLFHNPSGIWKLFMFNVF